MSDERAERRTISIVSPSLALFVLGARKNHSLPPSVRFANPQPNETFRFVLTAFDPLQGEEICIVPPLIPHPPLQPLHITLRDLEQIEHRV